jgi:hypothetical protein
LLEADLWLCTSVVKGDVAGGHFRREIRGLLQSRSRFVADRLSSGDLDLGFVPTYYAIVGQK